MSTGMKFVKFAGIVVLAWVLCLGTSYADSAHQRKTKKPLPPPPPLPSGPTGPVQQIPLDSIAPVPPQVTFQNGQLTIVAPNSTLGDILKAVRKQTGADIEVPAANERVVTHLGPGPVREVMSDLLNGSRFNYVLLGSAEDASLLTRVVLVAKSPDTGNPSNMQASQSQPGTQPGTMMQAGNVPPQQQPDDMAEAPEAAEADDTTDDNADQSAAEAEQQATPADQQGVKSPQQMLQEMQQRQLQQQQQQQQSGQPIPPPPPGRAPQEQ